jgi:hypothetical protein
MRTSKKIIYKYKYAACPPYKKFPYQGVKKWEGHKGAHATKQQDLKLTEADTVCLLA